MPRYHFDLRPTELKFELQAIETRRDRELAYAARRRLESGMRVRLCSFGLFGKHTKDIQSFRVFISYFHSPLLTGFEPAIEVPKNLPRRLRRFAPSGLRIWQIFSLFVGFGAIMKYIKKIPGHTT